MGVAPQDDVGQEHRARAHGDGGINIGGAGIQQTDAVLHQPGIQIGALASSWACIRSKASLSGRASGRPSSSSAARGLI